MEKNVNEFVQDNLDKISKTAVDTAQKSGAAMSKELVKGGAKVAGIGAAAYLGSKLIGKGIDRVVPDKKKLQKQKVVKENKKNIGGGVSGDGYIGPSKFKIKNPFTKKNNPVTNIKKNIKQKIDTTVKDAGSKVGNQIGNTAGPKIQKSIETGAENATNTAVAGSKKISNNLAKGVGKAALYTGAAVIGTKLASKAIDSIGKKKEKKKTVKEDKSPAWQRKAGKSESGGLNAKGVASYRAANPGSKLKTAVTTKPSKLKKGSKAANRRKSFCSRMKGMKAKLTSAKTARDPDSRINKSLRKWNC